MTDAPVDPALLIMLVGAVVVVTTVAGAGLQRVGVPAIVGFIVFGLILRAADGEWRFLSTQAYEEFEFLANAGIVVLLFRIGLESDLVALFRQLRRAAMVWLGDVGCSAALGFLAAYALLGYGLIPALFVGSALSATSVGVSAGVWREENALKTDNGALLLDVAELDDISGVVLMSLLLALVPMLSGDADATLLPTLAIESASVTMRFVGFCALCVLFSRYAERRLTGWFARIEPRLGPMLLVAGLGFMIAALAAKLGLSLAIGAMFAGLAFSRDPKEAAIDKSFAPLFRFFGPFFFVGIGLAIDLASLDDALGLGVLLAAVAALGKILGAGLPAAAAGGRAAGLLIGVSMVPRAEIAMIIMLTGRQLGDWAVPPALFGGMVFVTLASCILAPVAVRALLRRYPQRPEATG